MWPFTSSSCLDSCAATPPSLLATLLDPAVLSSLLPLTVLYISIFVLAYRRLFPLLSQSRTGEQGDYFLPSHAPPALHAAHAAHASRTGQSLWGMLGFGGGANGGGRQRMVFATTVALEAELAGLILVDIAGLLDTRARGLMLGVTVKGLVAMLVGVIPALELHSALNGVGWWRRASAKRNVWWPWMLFLALFAGWISLFWSTGRFVPGGGTSTATRTTKTGDNGGWTLETLTKATVSRIGVIGIASLALLSGFASITTPWHTFGCSPARRTRPISETDIARRQAGLDAATEMRVSKQHRLRSLLRKSELPRSSTSSIDSTSGQDSTPNTTAAVSGAGAGSGSGGALGKFLGAVRSAISSDPDQAEIKMLQLEIQGLEDMEARLQSGLAALLTRRKEAARAATPLGRWVYRPAELGLAAFCVYRVLATIITVAVRVLFNFGGSSSSAGTGRGGSIWGGGLTQQEPEPEAATTDPITRSIALLTSHLPFVAGKIDPAAWTRTVAFLMSGVILVGSANSVVQTARLFGRLGSSWFGKRGTGVLGTVRRNLVLGLAQVGGAYVLGAALMLRGRVGATAERLAGRGSWLRGSGYGYGGGGYGREGAVFEVFGDLGEEEGTFVDRWFEGWFLYGALGTMAGIWMLGVISGRWAGGPGGTLGDDEWWEEEEEWEERGGVELGWKRS